MKLDQIILKTFVKKELKDEILDYNAIELNYWGKSFQMNIT